MRQPKTYTLEDELSFGKYQGKALKEVIDTNAGYVVWMIDEIEWFSVDDEADDYLEGIIGQDNYSHDDDSWHDGWPGAYGDN